MKFTILPILGVLLTACATSIEHRVQEECSDRNKSSVEKNQVKCGGLNEVIDAIATDIQIAKEVTNFVKEEYLTNKEKNPPKHEGEDSNLCTFGQEKTCNVSNGCLCIEQD